MKTILPPRTQSRIVSLLLYLLALSLVLMAPALGMLAAAVAVWHALLAGSIWYMPLGLVMVLATIAVVYSHKLFDLALLGLATVGLIAWFMADSLQQARLVESLLVLAPQTGLMSGLLVIMLVALVMIHAARRTGRW
jgi:hypothetical protein